MVLTQASYEDMNNAAHIVIGSQYHAPWLGVPTQETSRDVKPHEILIAHGLSGTLL